MSVHRLRIFHSESGASDFHGWLSQYLGNMTPWTGDEVTNEPPSLRKPIDDSPFYGGDLAFDWSEDKRIILDQIEGYISSYCEWYRIGYHVCPHDEENPSPCSWTDENSVVVEGGTIPNHVPSLN